MTDLPASGSDGGGRPTRIEKPTRVELLQVHIQLRNTLSCLEKAMSEHGVTCRALKIEEQVLGTDYWFPDRTHALDFVQFIEGVVPVKKQSDDDGVSATFFSLQILPICQDDLILGSVVGLGNNFVICTGVAAHGISLMNPFTLQTAFLTAEAYWRAPCTMLMFGCDFMAEYLVLDITTTDPSVANDDDSYCLADAHIVRVSDLGKKMDDQKKLLVRTHLGRLLKPGDYALGYDIAGAVILVKKKSVAAEASSQEPSVDTVPDRIMKILFSRELDPFWLFNSSRHQISKESQIHGQQQQPRNLLNWQQQLQRDLLNMHKDINQRIMYMNQVEQQFLGSLPTTSDPQAIQGAILLLKQTQQDMTQLLAESLQLEMHRRLQGPGSLLQAHNAIVQKPSIQALQEVSSSSSTTAQAGREKLMLLIGKRSGTSGDGWKGPDVGKRMKS